MSIDFNFAWQTFTTSWPMFWYGIKVTLALAFVGTLVGLVIGLIIGAIRGLSVDPLDGKGVRVLKGLGHLITRLYIWIFRGTPMMVQAVFLYYLLRPVIGWTSLTAGMVIISINTGAYMAEIIRSGIQSIDVGQTEAAKSLGMTNTQTMMSIIFPQAIRNSFPSIGNQLIVNIKDSSMLNAIAVTELFFQTTSIAGSTMRYLEVYMIACIIYLILTTIASIILNAIEKHMSDDHQVSIKANV
ncbi:amino acid ABC transporter permease [Catenisphaera adipataccumulans]|jgi:putative lysine transport system permease protein|uniref:Putative lysine transport system permease protein n=1 Tax=Catenisphaera adipataccumulans TaxID=700500 RepID=A0A7W8FXC7_9FIRM|nr:amino acid ABC transporter permease [Catenisphaera adipataccumulans]MBB5182812.1 putative lysine transport system permease protein [Catenisphaera adipataccumulans]